MLTDKQNKIVESLGYTSPCDFLFHFPHRYQFLEYKTRDTWKPGDVVVFSGFLASSFKTYRFGRNRSATNFEVNTNDEVIKVVIYNRSYLKESNYTQGITVTGQFSDGKVVARTITNKPLDDVLGIEPQYPLKSGIKNYEVIRLMKKTLSLCDVEDVIPREFRSGYKLISTQQALKWIHVPNTKEQLYQAQRTLKYDEFLKYQVSIALNKSDFEYGISKRFDNHVIETYQESLPFVLTEDQNIALHEILGDLKSNKRMNRLLQGDVGSGKTIVSFLSLIAAIEAGFQVAYMVPTEVLLYQHAASFAKLFPNIDYSVYSQNSENKVKILEDLKDGNCPLVFGTHALFQDDVHFNKLGFVLIDEQHRFGVLQRQKLVDKGDDVDLLMLSATPIPRTLANTLFYDLDISNITHYPSHRKESRTELISENSVRTLLPQMKAELSAGGQIYIVCAAIDEDERPGVKTVLGIHEQMQKLFPEYNTGILHGRMSGQDKQIMMTSFANHEIDILVSTTVIEVGLDVHNANMMIIYNAEQFGLATLHQLRGRIGRGEKGGLCYLLSKSESEESNNRLQALVQSHDGFELSMIDMRQRGYGDALGVRQSGLPQFLLGDIEKDIKIMEQAKKDAQRIVANSDNPDYIKILEHVKGQDYFKTI
ncbi:ATP-dependent DNA helicase RecG [Erysipelothrix inopinata]|nr:ATP-dependent DNA helicase RecG [Erysipelothrix inopinata]